MTSPSRVSHLGGRMYGDGEHVVTFEVSEHAPLKAVVIGDGLGGSFVEVSFPEERKPSTVLAAQAIASARNAVRA